jgi:hypothetical protein
MRTMRPGHFPPLNIFAQGLTLEMALMHTDDANLLDYTGHILTVVLEIVCR